MKLVKWNQIVQKTNVYTQILHTDTFQTDTIEMQN